MGSLNQYVINYINNNSLLGIKAGSQRKTFHDIWMVVAEDRIFARSWGLNEDGWHAAFLNNIYGEINCGDLVVKVRGVIPEDLEYLTEPISNAYLAKYDHGGNSFYARRIIGEKYVGKTMEFKLV